MIRCVALDFDGTLVDSNRIKHDTFFDVVAAVSGRAEVMSAVLLDRPGDRFEIFRQFIERSPDLVLPGTTTSVLDRAAVLGADYSRRCEDAIAVCPEIPGAQRLLGHLHQRGVTVALISATPAVALDGVVARRGWSDAFGYVIGGAVDKSACLRRISAATGLAPAEMLMVGDRQVDQAAAAHVGCRFIAVVHADSDFATPPEHAVTDLFDLVALIERFGKSSPMAEP